MTTQAASGRTNGQEEENFPADRRGNGRGRKRPASQSGEREPLLNTIEARRRPKKARSTPQQAGDATRVDESGGSPRETLAGERSTAESDPWTVPQSVRDRFVQDGHRFYFPDGKEAFKDRGRRLTTASENTQVIHSMIEIARSRGWTELTVRGTERFRQEAWRQARVAGLSVRGYRPNETEQAQLIRALGRGVRQGADRVDSVST